MDPGRTGRHATLPLGDNISTRNKNLLRLGQYHILVSSIVHIFPVGVTFGILQLSFRNVYWADANAADQNLKLAALQIAAKVHEILILLSMSAMILHYARKLIISSQGMSLGLLVATYQSALSAQPWTIGYWETFKQIFMLALRNDRPHHAGTEGSIIHPLALFVLLAVFAFFALFVGPASAITMIPQLQWWERGSIVGSWQNHTPPFSIYIPTTLFPIEVNSSHLPGSFCDVVANDNGTCPSAGTPEVEDSFLPRDFAQQSTVNSGDLQNETITPRESDFFSRRWLYMKTYGQATVMIPNFVLASFASLLKIPEPSTDNSQNSLGSFILEIIANGRPPLSPLVNVNCNDFPSGNLTRYYLYETDGFSLENRKGIHKEDVRKNTTFDIGSAWNEHELAKNVSGFELLWKDVTQDNDTPVLLGLVRHEKGVTICSVQSYWTSTSQWILSASSYDVVTNFTFNGPKNSNWSASMFGYPYALNERPIHIREDWAEALNARNGSTKVLDAVIQTVAQRIPDWYWSNYTHTQEFVRENTVAQLLAKSVADGLSRIGAQYAANSSEGLFYPSDIIVCHDAKHWCSQGPWIANNTVPYVIVANVTRDDVFNGQRQHRSRVPYDWFYDDTPIMRSFAKPRDAEAVWTRVSFPVLRYGRGYAFQGVAMYLSVALLCFHAVIVVVHVANRLIFDSQTFDFGGSLGSLLVLAMGENGPVENNMWTSTVALIPYRDAMERKRLKLVVAESGTDQEVPRKYQEEKYGEMEIESIDEARFDEIRKRHPGLS